MPIADHLAAIEPWAVLPREDRERLAEAGETVEAADGEVLIDVDAPPEAVFVLREGQLRISDGDGTPLFELGAGSTAGARRLLDPDRTPVRVAALGAAYLIRLPAKDFLELAERHASLADFFDDVRARSHAPRRRSLAHTPVVDLMSREIHHVAPDLPLAEAAMRMREGKVSSVVVCDEGRLAGIFTVRDAATRVLSERLDPDRPVRDAMSHDPVSLPPDAAGSDVLHLMMERGISHVPILDGDDLVGIVSKTDLTRFEAETSAEVIGDVAGAGSVEALAKVTARIPDLLVQLVGAGNRHDVVTRYITDIADAVTRRLLAMAETELGTPPAPYCWAACGSQGRREQTGVSDQDNVLILSDEATDDHDAYFERLAEFVSDGLDACGYVYCPGDMMATNPRWRKPLSVWQRYFREWIENPSGDAQMLASVMFDLRPIGGTTALFETLQREGLGRAARNSIFVAHMTSNALGHQPPLNFWKSISTKKSGAHRDTIDMKMNGVVPVVDLGRIYALRGGLRAVNTRERLVAARDSGVISGKGGQDLLDAYDLIARTRLEHQSTRVRAGEAPDNFMPPARLSAFERSHLREAFLVVRSMQSAAGQQRGLP